MKGFPVPEWESTHKKRCVGGRCVASMSGPRFQTWTRVSSLRRKGFSYKKWNFLIDRPAGGKCVAYLNSPVVGLGLHEANVKGISVPKGPRGLTLLRKSLEPLIHSCLTQPVSLTWNVPLKTLYEVPSILQRPFSNANFSV